MLELPRQGGSNEYPQSMFWKKITQIGIPLQTPVFLYKSGVQVDYVFLIIKKNWRISQGAVFMVKWSF